MRRLTASISLGTLIVLAAPARADEAGDKAAAQALFDEARRLMAGGQYAQACPKFEGSQRLDPGVGTMLNLADCYEKLGRTASAWVQFRDTITAARSAGSIERETIARERANALEQRLSTITIVTWRGQEVVVTRNGATVDAVALGTPLPVDPGAHVIAASAEGKRSWSTTVQVDDGTRVSVAVPILPDEIGEGGVVPAPASTRAAPAAMGAGSDRDDAGDTQRIWALAAGGVGVVGIVVGSIFGLSAMSDWDDAKAHCDPYPYCGEDGARLADDAQSSATISTIAFGVGAAGVAGGLVLWFTADDGDASDSAKLGVGPGRVRVQGRF